MHVFELVHVGCQVTTDPRRVSQNQATKPTTGQGQIAADSPANVDLAVKCGAAFHVALKTDVAASHDAFAHMRPLLYAQGLAPVVRLWPNSPSRLHGPRAVEDAAFYSSAYHGFLARLTTSPLTVPRTSRVWAKTSRSRLTTPSTITELPVATRVSSTVSFAGTVTNSP